MAVQPGKNGSLSIGAAAVAQLRNWNLETAADPLEHSVIGNQWREYVASMSGWQVSVEGYYDTTDTGQGGLSLGTEVAVDLKPAVASGEKEYTGQAIVTAFNETAAFDGIVEFTATLQGTGALTEGVQGP